MTAPSPDPLDALLAMQAIDTDIDRQQHRRASLPERAELIAIDQELAVLDGRLAEARAQRDGAASDEQALGHTLAGVEKRAAEVKKRLYGGTVSATRELQAMSAEVDSLTARAAALESRVLEVMEGWELLDSHVTGIEGEKSSRLAARARMGAKLAAEEALIDGEIRRLNAARAEAAAHVAPELAATYEGLRSRLGGVGAARLVGSRCGGCHLSLSATELDHLRHQPSGSLSFCEQCGRILVPNRG